MKFAIGAFILRPCALTLAGIIMFTPSFPPADAAARAELVEWIRQAPLVYGPWQNFKRLYKEAETACIEGARETEVLAALLAPPRCTTARTSQRRRRFAGPIFRDANSARLWLRLGRGQNAANLRLERALATATGFELVTRSKRGLQRRNLCSWRAFVAQVLSKAVAFRCERARQSAFHRLLYDGKLSEFAGGQPDFGLGHRRRAARFGSARRGFGRNRRLRFRVATQQPDLSQFAAGRARPGLRHVLRLQPPQLCGASRRFVRPGATENGRALERAKFRWRPNLRRRCVCSER